MLQTCSKRFILVLTLVLSSSFGIAEIVPHVGTVIESALKQRAIDDSTNEIIELLECLAEGCRKPAGEKVIRQELIKKVKSEDTANWLLGLQFKIDGVQSKLRVDGQPNREELVKQFESLEKLRKIIIEKGEPSTFFFTPEAIATLQDPVGDAWKLFEERMIKERLLPFYTPLRPWGMQQQRGPTRRDIRRQFLFGPPPTSKD